MDDFTGLSDLANKDIEALNTRVKYLEDENAKLKSRIDALEVEREAEKAMIADNEDLREKLVDLGYAVAKMHGTIEWSKAVLAKWHGNEKPEGNFSSFENINRKLTNE